MNKRYSKWYNMFACTSCSHELSHDEKFYNGGRCPHCGYKGQSSVTIVDSKSRGYRYVFHRPWYIFWEIPTKEFKD